MQFENKKNIQQQLLQQACNAIERINSSTTRHMGEAELGAVLCKSLQYDLLIIILKQLFARKQYKEARTIIRLGYIRSLQLLLQCNHMFSKNVELYSSIVWMIYQGPALDSDNDVRIETKDFLCNLTTLFCHNQMNQNCISDEKLKQPLLLCITLKDCPVQFIVATILSDLLVVLYKRQLQSIKGSKIGSLFVEENNESFLASSVCLSGILQSLNQIKKEYTIPNIMYTLCYSISDQLISLDFTRSLTETFYIREGIKTIILDCLYYILISRPPNVLLSYIEVVLFYLYQSADYPYMLSHNKNILENVMTSHSRHVFHQSIRPISLLNHSYWEFRKAGLDLLIQLIKCLSISFPIDELINSFSCQLNHIVAHLLQLTLQTKHDRKMSVRQSNRLLNHVITQFIQKTPCRTKQTNLLVDQIQHPPISFSSSHLLKKNQLNPEFYKSAKQLEQKGGVAICVEKQALYVPLLTISNSKEDPALFCPTEPSDVVNHVIEMNPTVLEESSSVKNNVIHSLYSSDSTNFVEGDAHLIKEEDKDITNPAVDQLSCLNTQDSPLLLSLCCVDTSVACADSEILNYTEVSTPDTIHHHHTLKTVDSSCVNNYAINTVNSHNNVFGEELKKNDGFSINPNDNHSFIEQTTSCLPSSTTIITDLNNACCLLHQRGSTTIRNETHSLCVRITTLEKKVQLLESIIKRFIV